MSSGKCQEILCLTSRDAGSTLQINVGVLFAKDNLPQLDGLDAGRLLSGQKDGATEQGSLVST